MQYQNDTHPTLHVPNSHDDVEWPSASQSLVEQKRLAALARLKVTRAAAAASAASSHTRAAHNTQHNTRHTTHKHNTQAITCSLSLLLFSLCVSSHPLAPSPPPNIWSSPPPFRVISSMMGSDEQQRRKEQERDRIDVSSSLVCVSQSELPNVS